MKLYIVIFLLFITNFSMSQMLDNSKGETFSNTPFFNTAFIKLNKVERITGYYSSKSELESITKSNNIYVYQFNQNGELIKEFKTKDNDTIVSQYEYDKNGNLSQIRKSDKYGFHSYHFKYDSIHRIISQEYRRDINKSTDKTNFELNKSYYISSEFYRYENTPIGLKKLYYNSKNKIFKTEFFYRDEDGYLLKQDHQLKTGSGRGITTYKYGDKGLLTEKFTETHIIGKTSTKMVFEYDEFENVLAQHYYRNETYLTEYQIIYNEKTMLLSAILTRDVKLNFITILKFTDYSFFGDASKKEIKIELD
jgi:YD repeat-containing protein